MLRINQHIGMNDKEETTLVQKYHPNVISRNYRPITCLHMMLETPNCTEKWINCMSRIKERKGHTVRKRATDDLSYINQHIFNEFNKMWKKVATAWIDLKIYGDMDRQTSMTEYLKMYKIFDKVINFNRKAMETGKWNLQRED